MVDNYVIGAKYEIHIPKNSRFFSDQLPEGFIGTLSSTNVSSLNQEVWGTFEECKRFNYILKYCIKIESQSRTNKMLNLITRNKNVC